MAGKVTYFAINKFLDELVAKTSTLDLGTIYCGLSTTTPTDSNSGATGITEPDQSAGYSRVLLGSSAQSLTQLMGSASEGKITNTSPIKFDEVLASWGTITHFVIFDAKTGGHALAYGHLVDDGGLDTTITPTVNSIPIIRSGGLEISIT